jgi:hypothetical protein
MARYLIATRGAIAFQKSSKIGVCAGKAIGFKTNRIYRPQLT